MYPVLGVFPRSVRSFRAISRHGGSTTCDWPASDVASVLPSLWIGKNDKHNWENAERQQLDQMWVPVTENRASMVLGCGEESYQLPPQRNQSEELVAIGNVKRLAKPKQIQEACRIASLESSEPIVAVEKCSMKLGWPHCCIT